MKTLNKNVLFLLVALCTPNVFASESTPDLIVVKGYGKDIEHGLIDAKQRLSQRMLSDVSVVTEMSSSKRDQNTTSDFSQNIHSKSHPLTLSEMTLISESCNEHTCTFTFEIDKKLWASTLRKKIDFFLSRAVSASKDLDISWGGYFTNKASEEELRQVENMLLVLTNLDNKEAEEFESQFKEIDSLINENLELLQIKTTSDSKPISNLSLESLVPSKQINHKSDLIIFARSSTKSGKSNGKFASKATLEIQLLDNRVSYSGGEKRTLTQIAYSSKSKQDAEKMASEKLLEQLKEKSLLDIF